MYDISDRFAAAIKGTHTPVETATVIDHDGTTLATLDVVGGDVTEDAGAIIRHHTQMTVVDPDGTLTPTDLDDLLMPIGTRVLVQRGLRFEADELYPLVTGWLADSRATLDNEGRATIPLAGYDRCSRLQRDTVRPLAIAPGRPYPDAIYDALLTVDPGLDAELMSSEWTTPRLLYEAETDMLAETVEMATAIGAELFVSREDTLVLRPIPLRTGTPVWRLVEGATVVSAEVAWSTDQRPNGVIVIGQHSSMSTPVRGEAWDTDPASPTYRYGPLGENPRFLRTEKAVTPAQCAAMAKAKLEDLGGAQEIDVDVFPAPVHLLTGDVVTFTSERLGMDGVRFIVQRMVTPLATPDGPAQMTLRRGVLDE